MLVKRSVKAYVLVTVLAVIAILLTLVAALQYQGMARRRASLLMEAQYLASRASESLESGLEVSLGEAAPSSLSTVSFADDETTGIVAGVDPLASLDRNSIFLDSMVAFRGGDHYGAKLFSSYDSLTVGTGEQSLRTVELKGRDRVVAPLTLRIEGKATSWNPSLDLFRRNRWQSIYAAGFPYAAYAPGAEQSIHLEKVSTWASPGLSTEGAVVNPLDEHTGLTPYLGAGGPIVVGDFPYGHAYSRSGKIEVKGGAIGFRDYLPYETWGKTPYTQLLERSIDRASSTLSGLSTDKTGAIFGKLNLGETIRLVSEGRIPKNFLTYQSAAEWWFFLLPSIKTGGVFMDLRLHVPLPADTQALADGVGASGSITKIDRLNRKNDELQAKLLPEGTPDRGEWGEATPGLLPRLHWAAREYRKAHNRLEKMKEEQRARELSGDSDSTKSKRAKEIEKQQRLVDKKQREAEELDKSVQALQDEIRSNKEKVQTLTQRLQDNLDTWVEGDPKGPNRITELVMSQIGVGVPVDVSKARRYPPKNAKAQKKIVNSETKLLSNKGMLFHSYVSVVVRLAAQMRRLVETAINSFPTREITIDFIIFKRTIRVPDHSRREEWMKKVRSQLVTGLTRMVVYEVPLLFMDGVPLQGIEDGHFEIRDTFQVPRGRTFKLTGDMTITGDLWLQKGSSMTVTGNLTMKDPVVGHVVSFGDIMNPHGRIFLESGSSLIVGGDLQGAGDKYLGSVVSCGPVDRNQALTTAILCQGKVTLPHGTGGGNDLENLVGWMKGEEGQKVCRDLLEDWVPNLSKVPKMLGSFSPRMPYFGRYPVILRIYAPKPVPIPTFEPIDQNLNVYLFRALTALFSIQMNSVLGENFSTTTLWWAYGSEQVAVFPSGSSKEAKDDLEPIINSLVSGLQWVRNKDVNRVIGGGLRDGLSLIQNPQKMAKASLVPIAAQALNPDPTGLSNQLVDRALEPILGSNSTAAWADRLSDELNLVMKSPGGEDYNILDPALAGALRRLRDAVNGLQLTSGIPPSSEQLAESANHLLVMCPGVFVYARDHLQLGPADWHDSPSARAVGCFVSKGDVTANARYTVGSLLSLQGSIRGRELYFTPYFTRVSLYKPKELRKGGTGLFANEDYWANAVNLEYGSRLDSGQALDIPRAQVFFRTASGWGK